MKQSKNQKNFKYQKLKQNSDRHPEFISGSKKLTIETTQQLLSLFEMFGLPRKLAMTVGVLDDIGSFESKFNL